MIGYVKLYRSIEQWEWYTDLPTFKLFTHCLIKANHKPGKWRGMTVETGSFITSYAKLAKETGLSVKQVRTALNHLKSTNEVAHETASEYSRITIVKWRDYQSTEEQSGTEDGTEDGRQGAGEGQAKGRQRATNNNDKNDKNDKNDENKDSSADDETRESIESKYKRIQAKPFSEPLTEEDIKIIRLHEKLSKTGWQRIG